MVKLQELFEVRYGHSLELNRLTVVPKSEGIPFVSRKMGDNGIATYVKRIPDLPPAPAGELTCALSGNGVLSTFIQDKPFYTAFHVACLRPLVDLTKSQLLYYCHCIKANRYRFNYGRQANRTLKDILLPEVSEIPSWVASTDIDLFEGAQKPALNKAPLPLNIDQWKVFELQDLFNIERGKGPRRKDLDGSGDTPFITSTDSNNGFTMYTKEKPTHQGNTIGVNRNGSVGEAFYQPIPFCSTEDVHIFIPKKDWGNRMSAAVGLFLATLIRQEKYRFNYGRKWGIERMKVSTIMLPVTKEGNPDWDYMETYIKSLPYSSQI